jgi:hypothetical protein
VAVRAGPRREHEARDGRGWMKDKGGRTGAGFTRVRNVVTRGHRQRTCRVRDEGGGVGGREGGREGEEHAPGGRPPRPLFWPGCSCRH